MGRITHNLRWLQQGSVGIFNLTQAVVWKFWQKRGRKGEWGWNMCCSLSGRHRPARGFPHRCGRAGGDFIMNMWMWSEVGATVGGGAHRWNAKDETEEEKWCYTECTDTWQDVIHRNAFQDILSEPTRRHKCISERHLIWKRKIWTVGTGES